MIARIRKLGVVVAAAVMAVVSFGSVAAHADSNFNGSVAIAPVSQELTINPGESASGVMYIDTLGDTPISPHIYTTGYAVSGLTYAPSYAISQLGHDASTWIHTNATSYSNITRGHRVTLDYTIQVPRGAAPGGYYAILFAQNDAPKAPNGQASVGANSRAGTILYLTVNGNLIQKGSVAAWKSSFWQTTPPLHSILQMHNGGNVHFRATYNVVITDFFGNKKAVLGDSNIILPDSTLQMNVDWSEAPAFGLFKVGGSVNYLGHDQVLPVRYVLMLSIWAFLGIVVALVALVLFAIFSRPKNVTRRNYN